MALLDYGNPTRYNTTTLPLFWSSAHADATVTGSGFNSTPGLTASSVNGYVIQYPLTAPADSVFALGCRIKFSDATPAAEKVILAAVAAGGAMQCCLSLSTTGYLKLWRGNMSSLLATSATAVTTAVWYKLGFYGLLDQAFGYIEGWVDNVRVVRALGVDTAQEASTAWRGLYLGLSSDWIAGHWYMLDGAGTHATLKHDLYVEVLAPTTDPGAGAIATDWVPDGAGTLFDAVDDSGAHDDEATKVSAVAGDGSIWGTRPATLADQPVILGAKVTNVVKNEHVAETGIDGQHEPTVVVDNSVQAGPVQPVVDTDWRAVVGFWPLNPVTGVPWLTSEINESYWGGRLQA